MTRCPAETPSVNSMVEAVVQSGFHGSDGDCFIVSDDVNVRLASFTEANCPSRQGVCCDFITECDRRLPEHSRQQFSLRCFR